MFARTRTVAPLAQLALARGTKRMAPQQVKRMSSKAEEGGMGLLINADQTIAAQKLFHKTSIACVVLTPVAFLAAPTPLIMPVDICLSILFPLHAHIGVNWILTDYVKAAKPSGPVRMALVGATGLAIIGLLKLSVTDGLLNTVKATWKPKEESSK